LINFYQKIRAEARSVFCYWTVRELGIDGSALAKKLKMSQPGVVYGTNRGEQIAKSKGLNMIR